MKNLTTFFEGMGRLDPYELNTSRLTILFVAPGLYLYGYLIGVFNDHQVEPIFWREIFTYLFFMAGILPIFAHQWSQKYYGFVVMTLLTGLLHYLIMLIYLNNFSMDYLLGFYIVLFGGILMLSHRAFILGYVGSAIPHMFLYIHISDLPLAEEVAISMSVITIFAYSFPIQNGFLRYKNYLKQYNSKLEKKVAIRTHDLESRAKELHLKNRELEEFAYVVSHDIKSPLRNVHALGTWLLEDINDGRLQQAKSNLQLLMNQVEQVDLLVDGILKYSLGIEKKVVHVPLDLNKLVNDLIRSNNSDRVLIEKDSALPRLLVDKAQMLQVFQNLIQNAIKYNDKPMTYINIGVVDEVDRFKFYVQDNGKGIAPDHFERIFKLFQKLDHNTRPDSTGIGLAVVKKIVDKNGGEIWLESKEGKGTTFYFTLYKSDVTNNFGNQRTKRPPSVVHL